MSGTSRKVGKRSVKKGANFTHLAADGTVQMVDVAHKPPMLREATAQGVLLLAPETVRLLKAAALPKGDALGTARIAGIMAAKKCSELIPLCHSLPLSSVEVDFAVGRDRITITATARCIGPTGVEMEALCAVTTAGLALYDMCKAVDKQMRLTDVVLLKKQKLPLPGM